MKSVISALTRFGLMSAVITATVSYAPAQSFSGLDKQRVRGMLNVIKGEIKKNYYDPTFHGIDIDARFKEAEQKIDSVDSLSQGFGVIAQVLSEFNDSHLFFLPPPRPAHAEYGWQMLMIGDEAYVIAIKPGSDAESKGLKVGDRILRVDGFAPTRDNMWKMTYRYHVLRPQAGIKVVVQTGNEGPRELDLKAKIIEGKPKIENPEDIEAIIREIDKDEHLHRQRYVEMGDAFIWKMPRFDLDNDHVDELMSKASRHKTLILDLRSNGGGYEDTLRRMVGNLFDHDVKIAEAKRRKETKPILAKTHGGSAIKNDLIILIDSGSGSAAELLARVVQLEKRGKVIGDRSAGAVMRSQGYYYEMGGLTTVSYGASVTDADLIMADGKSLEHTGVMPDDLIIPSGADLAAKRDPVLARAAALVGVELTAEKAGAIFPIEWK